MIKAFYAEYLKYDHEPEKRFNNFCVFEMTINKLENIQLIVIDEEKLVTACSLESITEISGYHRYLSKDGVGFGAGKLKPLNTKDSRGMLEGLSEQMHFNYQKMATAFAEGLLQLQL